MVVVGVSPRRAVYRFECCYRAVRRKGESGLVVCLVTREESSLWYRLGVVCEHSGLRRVARQRSCGKLVERQAEGASIGMVGVVEMGSDGRAGESRIDGTGQQGGWDLRWPACKVRYQ